MGELIIEWGASLRDHYPMIKVIHLIAVIVWSASAIGGFYYVIVAYLQQKRAPDDEELRRRYDWVRWHFNFVVILEHIAFLIILPTGFLMAGAMGWPNITFPWLAKKLFVVFAIFVPMEIMDIALSHWLGPKSMLNRESAPRAYELVMKTHDWFLAVATVIVLTGIPYVVYQVIVKPA